jgi:hypothetical protein
VSKYGKYFFNFSQIEDVAKVLSADGDTDPKVIGSEPKASGDEEESGSNAPPSTPTKGQDKKPRRVVFNDFPRFKVIFYPRWYVLK